jgi:hypothetical protein
MSSPTGASSTREELATRTCIPSKRPLEVIDLATLSDDDDHHDRDDHRDVDVDVDDDDDDIQVCSPPAKKMATSAAPLLPSSSSPLSPSQDSPQVAWSNLTNPNVDYLHRRVDCGVHSFSKNPLHHCPKCYCVVCDIPAGECSTWSTHCQVEGPNKAKTGTVGTVGTVPTSTSTTTATPNPLFYELEDAMEAMDAGLPYNARRRMGKPSEKHPSELRITDVLAQKLKLTIEASDGAVLLAGTTDGERFANNSNNNNRNNDGARPPPTAVISKLQMEGDIGPLRLHNTFFVEGIKIGWPFSTILTPQRLMAIHIIKALKRKLHVVLESPTGTGKSAAILCSVLAWQRYHVQLRSNSHNNKNSNQNHTQEDAQPPDEDDLELGQVSEPKVPTIIYCSRTHSQVAQMVASLQKTPYRPRMTVLGSRDRLCINR